MLEDVGHSNDIKTCRWEAAFLWISGLDIDIKRFSNRFGIAAVPTLSE